EIGAADDAIFKRVGPRVLPLVESRAMPLIRPRFQRKADCRAGAVSILRIDGVLLDVHLLDHIGRWNVTRLVADSDRSAVHLQIVGEVLAAAYTLLVGPPTVVGHVLGRIIVLFDGRI